MLVLFVSFTVVFSGLVSGYQTENIIVVSVDGIRDHEAFAYQFEPGQTEHPYIPFIWNTLKPQGTAFLEMYNVFCTFTSPGHSTILTGTWQMYPNTVAAGEWFQTRAWDPTIFEYARKQLGLPQSETWCVVGKKNCLETNWSLQPGYGETYGANLLQEPTGDYTIETDSLTVDAVMGVLDTDQPSLLFVNLQGVDVLGHYGDYGLYIQAIQLADRAVGRLWNRIQSMPHYSGNTTFIVTTDHGRHDDEHGGFEHHGGICHGCQHVMCLFVGPDTPAAVEVSDRTFPVDIAPTIGELYGFDTPFADGQVLGEAIIGYAGEPRLLMKDPATDVYQSNVYVTWSDNHTGHDEIYFLASYDNGETFGDTIQISSSGAAAIQPAINADDNGVHVVWLDFRQGLWELYYRRSEDLGSTWEDEQKLASNIVEDENGEGFAGMWEPHIVCERGGGMISVSAHPFTIAAMLSFDGGKTWDFELIDNGAYFPVNVNGCRLGGKAGVTWCDQAWTWSGERNWEIYYKRSAGMGYGWGLWRRLTNNTSYSIQPSVDSNGTRRLGIAWADNESGNFQIYFRKSYNRGKSWYGRNTVSASPVGCWQPDLAYVRDTGEIHAVWTDYRDGHGELYYNFYTGSSWTTEQRVTNSIGSVNMPSFAIDENGNSFAVWEQVTASSCEMGMGNITAP